MSAPLSSPSAPGAQALKFKVRREALDRRRAVPDKTQAAQAVADRLARVLARVPSCDRKTVAAYHAIGDELPTGPVFAAVTAAHARLCLPVIVAPDAGLIFRLWQPGGDLAPAAFGIMQPPEDAVVVEPDILLVPLVAFDRRGHRIGYGRGYYDRTLAALRAAHAVAAIGLAFDVQEVDEVPADPNDQTLDMIITERRILTLTSNPVLGG